MKKTPSFRSAFFDPRVLISFVAVCVIGPFLALLAFALYPGGNALAEQTQTRANVPEFAQEQVNVAQGVVVSIRQMGPLEMMQMFDMDALGGPLLSALAPQTLPPSEADAGTVTLNVLPVDPTGSTPTPTPAGSMVLLDTFTGQPTLTFAGSVPRTYMGDGFTNNVLPGGTTYVSIRSYTAYMLAAVVANYTDIHARLALWNTYVQTGTEVTQFSNLAAFFDVDLGPINVTTAPVFFSLTVTVLPPFPFLAGGAGTQWGYAQNFQGSTTGGAVADDSNLTSLITANADGAGAYPVGQITSGTTPNFGYYRNASGLTTFNFLGPDLRSLGLVSQAIGIIIRGDLGTGPTPTPAATGTPTPTPTAPPTVCSLPTEGFVDINTLPFAGWAQDNNSTVIGSTRWFQGNTAVFPAQAGPANSYIGANFNSDGGPATDTISNWLLTPPVTLQNGATLIFWTRTVNVPRFPDRLQVRMSTAGTSSNVGTSPTDVGDFTTLLLDINPTYLLFGPGSYPNFWTPFSVTISGLGLPIKGRLAFRYFVENGGPAGVNSDFIGIDSVEYDCGGMATPTPPPTPTPIPTASPTPTPTPSVVSVTGTVIYCTNPVLPPIPLVTMSLTGAPPAPTSTLTDGSGLYTFSGLTVGASYTVTPTKGTKPPGTSGIATSDSIAIQRHFLNLGTPLTGCRLLAADTNDPPNGVSTPDAIAAQRFFLGLSTGIAQTGRYKFTPVSTSYSPILANMTAQNYNAVILGDAATAFVAPRPDGGPEPDAAIENEIASTVASVKLDRDSVSSSAIDAKSNLVGFQGDFTFDERVVTFASQPVSNAGLTAGNWNVSGNVLAGPGPIRTLRVSAFSLDSAPLSGTGVLFNVNMISVDRAAQGAPLVWASAGEPFVFIDANLNTQRPGHGAPSQR